VAFWVNSKKGENNPSCDREAAGRSSCYSASHRLKSFATLVHEVAHERLHRAKRRGKHSEAHERESEAEAGAFVVC